MKFPYAAIAAATLVLAACSNFAGQAQAPISEELLTATATIDSVDKKERIIKLHSDQDGQAYTVYANDGIKNLDQLTAGDTVVMEYYEATALSMADPDAPDATSTVVAAEAPKGALPGGAAAQTETVVVEVISYDAKDGIATFRTPDGLTRRTAVPPRLQSFAAETRRGDKVEVTMTQAVAVSIAPAGN